MITVNLQIIEGYLYLILHYCICIILSYSINQILLYIIHDYILFILLDIIIVVIQTDNFSLYYDYLNLKKYYEKLISDEYRINKLSNISNNLLKRFESLQEDYFELLEEYDNNSEISEKNINKIKLLNIEMCKYKSLLYNRIENKLNKLNYSLLEDTYKKLKRSVSADSLNLKLLKLEDTTDTYELINMVYIKNSLNSGSENSISSDKMFKRRTKSSLKYLYDNCDI